MQISVSKLIMALSSSFPVHFAFRARRKVSYIQVRQSFPKLSKYYVQIRRFHDLLPIPLPYGGEGCNIWASDFTFAYHFIVHLKVNMRYDLVFDLDRRYSRTMSTKIRLIKISIYFTYRSDCKRSLQPAILE